MDNKLISTDNQNPSTSKNPSSELNYIPNKVPLKRPHSHEILSIKSSISSNQQSKTMMNPKKRKIDVNVDPIKVLILNQLRKTRSQSSRLKSKA
jgi:hypothetical protein